jgi:c-di-GMP-binding flagellar brake protein YcgR
MSVNDADNAPSQEFEVVEDPVKIHRFLERIQSRHLLLQTRVPTVNGFFNSVILEIDPDRRWLTLDELHPGDGHQKFVAQRRLTVFGECDGVDLRFDCNLVEVGSQNNIYFYRVSFPATLKYFQKRSAYRVRVQRAAPVPVILMITDGEYAKGELYNISTGGISVKFTRAIPKNIERGQTIPECELRLPDGEKFICAIEARHVIAVDGKDHVLLGARFLRLNSAQQRTINRFIASLEREQRRKAT